MNTHQAEIKPAKFGETLTSNVDGNPELSPNSGESVETRRRVCIKCESLLQGKRQKFCCDSCRAAYGTQQYRIRHGLIEKPGAGSGGNQRGSRNSQWKDGKASFNKLAFSHYPHKCDNCDATCELLVHHKDHDRLNNSLENLVIWCKRCHQQHHCTRDPRTGKYIKG